MASLLQILSKECMVFKMNNVLGVEIPPNILLTWFVGGGGEMIVCGEISTNLIKTVWQLAYCSS